jgi:hypothetical protein
MALFRRSPEVKDRPVAGSHDAGREEPGAFLPRRSRRSAVESFFARLVATGGIIGVGTAIGAGMAAGNVSGWLIGLVVSGVTVLLAAVLWSSRTL